MERNSLQPSKTIHFKIILKIDDYLIIFYSLRIVENGVETVITEEDGVVKTKTVNGVAQPIEYRK